MASEPEAKEVLSLDWQQGVTLPTFPESIYVNGFFYTVPGKQDQNIMAVSNGHDVSEILLSTKVTSATICGRTIRTD